MDVGSNLRLLGGQIIMHLMELQKPKSLTQAEVSVGRGWEVRDGVGVVIGRNLRNPEA